MRERVFPIGAEIVPGGGVDFRVWAPRSRSVVVEAYGSAAESDSDPDSGKKPRLLATLTAEGEGYFSGVVAEARAGLRYRFKTDRGSFPDPASRFQPEGPHGPSQVVDFGSFAWTDREWRGRPVRELVIYELHLGTLTPEGTWASAAAQLPQLARLGITMIEVMPIAEFPGRFGWGYDGVNLFAPTRLYGTPDDARRFVNRAHELGLGVILDVVYNHIGPDGNYIREFSLDYFGDRAANEWGDALNFDGKNCGPVREFFVTNARYWIREFHFDGLRLDATQQIHDASPSHILGELDAAVRREAGQRRSFVVAENEEQHPELVRPRDRGGHGMDALWNDDFHHAALVAATGRAEAYYSGFRGSPQEFVSSAKYGFLYQGQWYRWQQQRRGRAALDLMPQQFVNFLENHDQVANSLRGERLHRRSSPGRTRALTALLLLSPQIPMLFQGQEFAASAPFLYFADHEGELRGQVAEGRRKFLRQFPGIATCEAAEVLADPGDEQTFRRCKLDLAERERDEHRAAFRLHEDLLRLRREENAIAAPARFDGATLSAQAFVLRFFAAEGPAGDRLLIVNLGGDVWLEPAAEPLLSPARDGGWRVKWSSEAPVYGGNGIGPLETKASWFLPGESAVLLEFDENNEPPDASVSQKT